MRFEHKIPMELSAEEHKKLQVRRLMASKIAHAGWAGRHLATMLARTRRSDLHIRAYVQGILRHRYLVAPALVNYATRVAAEKLPNLRGY